MDVRERVLRDVKAELDRYYELWDRPDGEWYESRLKCYAVVGEEFGEIANALIEHDYDNLYTEIIQTASVLIAWAMTEVAER